MIEIIAPGPLSLVEDLGRPGFAHLGVSRSGALDRAALGLANRLVGNDTAAAGIEVTVGGLFVRFTEPTWFAVTGAWGPVSLGTAVTAQPGPTATVPGDAGQADAGPADAGPTDAVPTDAVPTQPVPADTAVHAPTGSVLSIGAAEHGVRYYLAVRGGVDATPTLGSLSTDTLSGLGPAPLAVGDVLGVGRAASVAIPALDALTLFAPTDNAVDVGVHLGPRDDWFTAEALRALFDTEWTVGADSNRVGARLTGSPLERSRDGELPSEGMVAGAIQVPPSGLPTVLLADHPVTGGYPVIAVVTDADLDTFAQLRPGQALRFRHARPLH